MSTDKNQDILDTYAELFGADAELKKDSNSSGEIVWTIEGSGVPGMKSKEMRLFLAGVKLGRTLRPAKAPRVSKHAALREAILKDGRVEVDVKDFESDALKIARNNLFTQAYALGLKGQFKVETVDGKLVGTVVK